MGQAKAVNEEKNKQSRKSAKKKTASPKKANASSTAKGKPWTFPKNLLEDAIRIPKAIEEKNAGNPMPASDLVKAVGYKSATDWRFTDLLKSANLYGLVSGTGATATIKMEKLGQDIVAPGSPKERKTALLEAFRNVKEFEEVEKFYSGKKIPEDEFFLNTLTRQFNIPRDRVDTFSEVFLKNMEYLRAFDVLKKDDTDISPASTYEEAPQPAAEAITSRRISKEPRGREFLESCFVMMPFGEWFDRYYQEIYMPAIKEAGFEPIRADELFKTGSVVEQIWEQIKKARILLAGLTGKNANVFYELGLAHAAKNQLYLQRPTLTMCLSTFVICESLYMMLENQIGLQNCKNTRLIILRMQ